MNPDELLMQIYNDMLDVMASGRPTGSTERLANELRAYLGQPEWPTLETSPARLPGESEQHARDRIAWEKQGPFVNTGTDHG